MDNITLSNASYKATILVVDIVKEYGGEIDEGTIKILVDKDPHHQINNAIKLGLLIKKVKIYNSQKTVIFFAG